MFAAARALLLLSSSASLLLAASGCADWKSLDLKKPEIPATDNDLALIQEDQSVDVQVTKRIQRRNRYLWG